MKIAIFGKKFDENFNANLDSLFNKLCNYNAEIFIYEPFYKYLCSAKNFNICSVKLYNNPEEITSDFNFVISLGGDGTFLEAVQYIRNTGVPVIGINTGRLGFLANIAAEEIDTSLDSLLTGNYELEKRSLIEFISNSNPFSDFPFGLNEITVQKRDTSLITIEVYINTNYLSTYWTDGLIISTPTGSTAYSMSVGGPILAPDCKAFIISPIASHNLTVRPIVITDDLEIKLKIEARAKYFMATIDSYSHELKTGTEISLKLAPFTINMVKLKDHNIYKTIRKKLMWGADVRN